LTNLYKKTAVSQQLTLQECLSQERYSGVWTDWKCQSCQKKDLQHYLLDFKYIGRRVTNCKAVCGIRNNNCNCIGYIRVSTNANC